MHGFAVFLGKEMREIVSTWRIWVLPLLMVFIGVTSPVIALITPDLLSSLATSSGQSGLVIQIPDPVTADAYLQFTKNATQIVLIAVIISVAGMIAAERRQGTAALVLTKPVSRTGMVVAKVLSNWVLLLGATVAGTLLCVGVTALVFDATLITEFASAAALWFALAALFVALMALLSVAIGSQGGAAGAGVALYLVLSILSAWGPARAYSPAGLLGAGDRIIAGQTVDVLWPTLSAVALAVLAVAAASWLFERQEL